MNTSKTSISSVHYFARLRTAITNKLKLLLVLYHKLFIFTSLFTVWKSRPGMGRLLKGD